MSLKIFVSYCRTDEDSTQRILNALTSVSGIDVLFDSKSIHTGDEFRTLLNDMINAADIVIANLTSSSLNSDEVLNELSRAQERGKLILPFIHKNVDVEDLPWFLQSVQHVFYSEASMVKELRPIVERLSKATLIPSCWILKETFGRKNLLRGLLIANLGFLVWHGVDKILEYGFTSIGSPLLQHWKEYTQTNFKGVLPGVWAISSNWAILLALALATKWRFGRLRSLSKEWRVVPTFLIFTAIAAIVFYNSGIDEKLRSLDLSGRALELCSTFAWSAVMSLVTISPFAICVSKFRSSFNGNKLRIVVLATIVLSMAALIPYWIFSPHSDVWRGYWAGAGLRSGMFLGLLLSATGGRIDEARRYLPSDTTAAEESEGKGRRFRRF